MGKNTPKIEDATAAIENLAVLEFKELLDDFKEKFVAVPAPLVAMPGAMPGALADGAGAFEVDVVITGAGDRKIGVIKAVRKITGVGLKDAKEMVEGAPNSVLKNVSAQVAEQLKASIEEAGGTVEFKPARAGVLPRPAATQIFISGVAEALDHDTTMLTGLTNEQIRMAGLEAGRDALARLRWAAAVGDRLDTKTVVEMLGRSRQALNERAKRGTLLGLPGKGTTWFPSWQFADGEVRAGVSEILTTLGEVLQSPLSIASWAQTPQAELDGSSAAEWLSADRPAKAVLEVAQRTAEEMGLNRGR